MSDYNSETKVEKKGAVSSALSVTEGLVNRLQGLVARLEERLEPFMRPSGETKALSEKEASEVSDFAKVMIASNEKFGTISDRLESIINRLDL